MNEHIENVHSVVNVDTLGMPSDMVRRQEYVTSMLGCSAICVDNTYIDRAYTVMSHEEIQRAAAARIAIAAEA